MLQATRAYCVGNFTIIDEALMADYAKQATPIAERFGGKLLTVDRNIMRLEGEAKSVVVIFEFPSLKAAEEFYYSTDYAAAKLKRIQATEGGFLLLAAGLPTGSPF